MIEAVAGSKVALYLSPAGLENVQEWFTSNQPDARLTNSPGFTLLGKTVPDSVIDVSDRRRGKHDRSGLGGFHDLSLYGERKIRRMGNPCRN